MSEKISELAPQILDLINHSNHILLHCHPSPDPDSIGSVLAVSLALKSLGKNVTVISGDSEPPKSLSFLPGFSEIIPKNYLEINPADFDLFLILDSSNTDMITKKGQVKFPETLKAVVIDHHASNVGFGQINLIEADYPATAQIVYELLKAWQLEITSEIARCLILGLYSDTGGFQYLTFSPDLTLRVASELARIYSDYPKDIFNLDNNNTPGRILFEGLALSSIKLYFNDKVAISEVHLKDWHDKGIKVEDTQKSDIANKLKSVVGWEIGIIFIEAEKNKINIGLRTREADTYDLSKLAASLGGGGHKAAAGATLNISFEQAKQLLLDKIASIYKLS